MSKSEDNDSANEPRGQRNGWKRQIRDLIIIVAIAATVTIAAVVGLAKLFESSMW